MAEIGGVELSERVVTRSSLELPQEIEDISAEFLTAALSKKFPGITVKDFKIVDVHHGFTTIVRLDLDLDEAGKEAGVPSTMMLKGGFEPSTRGKARDFAISPFLMETASYRVMQPTFGLNMPSCYFAEADIEQKQMIILMEDLCLRNVTFGNGLVTHTPDQVRRRLTALAELHAQSWGSPNVEQGGLWDLFPQSGCRMFRDYMYHAGYAQPQEWKKYIDAPRGTATAQEFQDVQWVLDALGYGAELSNALPNVVCHGDTHAGNLYEEPDGTPGFFDSLTRREPAMMEVSYFITNVMDHGERRRHDRDLIAHYRNELSRCGVDVPSLEELLHQFAAFLPFGYVTFIVNENTYQTESFNTAHAARYSVAMLDHNTREVVANAKLP